MDTVRIVAGTDDRDGVEVIIDINAGGNDELVDMIIDTLRHGVDFDKWGYNFDFVEREEYKTIPTPVPYPEQ